jgi:hypothetical protein
VEQGKRREGRKEAKNEEDMKTAQIKAYKHTNTREFY